MRMHLRARDLCSFLVAGVLVMEAAVCAHAGNAKVGLGLVTRYCDVCHAVGQALNPPNLAPPLLDLVPQQTSATGTWLRAWLKAPHPALPAALTEKQIEDIIAYLAGLSRRRDTLAP